MALPLIPAELDLVATSEDDLDSETDSAVYQGQTYTLALQILDDNGDPFDLGPTISPEWDFDAQLRSDFLSADSEVDATFTANVVDGPNGRVEFTLTPAQTAALEGEGGKWDLFITNKSAGGNADYAAGFSQMVARGSWRLEERVTEA
jgi:hypothetical protein